MLHNVVVLYRRTITFSYIVSTNQSALLRIPNVPARRRRLRLRTWRQGWGWSQWGEAAAGAAAEGDKVEMRNPGSSMVDK